MIRLRLNKLMSRASTLALAAFTGTVGSASAAPGISVTGPNQDHVHVTTNTNFVNITDAIVGIDPNVGGVNSFANDPGITIGSTSTGVIVDGSILQGRFNNQGTILGNGLADGVYLVDSTLQAGFTNSGNIQSDSFDGVDFESTILTGGITNSGRILGGTGISATGLAIHNSAASSRTISGLITNSGTISGDTGVFFGGKTSPLIIVNGLANSGEIWGDDGAAIEIGALTNFSGGITNALSGHILSQSDDGIYINATTFAGGINNSGEISGGTSGTFGNGIYLDSGLSSFTGGITNSGLISGGGTSADGIHIEADVFGLANTTNQGILNSGTIIGDESGIDITSAVTTFNGGITNTGTIIATSSTGIDTHAVTFRGGIVNSGLIDADDDGIHAHGDVFNGDIENSGTILSNTGTGIDVLADTVNGAVINSGTIISNDDGIQIDSSADSFNGSIAGGVVNSGLIRSTSSDGIDVLVDSFKGGVTNSGTIDAFSTAIAIGDDNGQTFEGGVTNTGVLLAGQGPGSGTGIAVSLDDFQGGILNNTTGKITADQDGIFVDATTFAGGISNAGTITAQSGIDVNVTTTFDGGVRNSGLIHATSGVGIDIDPVTFNGGVTNTGTIISADGGEGYNGINIVATNFNDGFLNSGLIDASGGVADGGTGVRVDVTNWSGGFVNSGTILADPDGTIVGATTVYAGVLVQAGVFDGGLTNSGLIDVQSGMGIYFRGTTFHDGIVNSGTIHATDPGTGIRVFADSFDGGFANSGVIDVTSGSGARFTVTGNFQGAVTNSGTIVAGSDAIHIDVGGTLSNGITNSGKLDAGDDGIRTEGGILQGGIKNLAGAQILAGETGIQTTNTTFAGGITNAGTIVADNRGIDVNVTGFSNGINNSGRIIVTSTGVEVDATTFTGGFVNSGTIEGNEGDGVNIDVGTFSDGFNNSGTILASDTGVVLDGTTFNGGFTNTGLIDGSETGVAVNVTTFNNGFTNSGTIVGSTTGVYFGGTNVNDGFTNSGRISANSYGVDIDVTNFTGDFTNSGTIEANSETTVNIDATNFTGNFANSGTITSATQTGVIISVDNFIGNFSNSGLIEAQSIAVELSSTEISGNVVNSGTIHSDTSTALYLTSSEIGGFLSNSGIIESDTDNAIVLSSSSSVLGGIRNTGSILAGEGSDAIDASGSAGALTITLAAGVVEGDIDLQNGNNDTLNLNGGTLAGDILGYLGDDIANVNAGSGEFAYISGEINGFDRFYVNSGTAILGSDAVGNNGDGVTDGGEGIDLVRVKSGATLYLDDDTVLDDVGDFTQETTGDTQFLLSLDAGVEKSGQIVADTIDLRGKITGVIDANAFANSGGISGPFVYEDVFATSSGLSSDLSYNLDANGVTILNDLIFFDIAASTSDNDGTVDLIVDRLSFSEVLAAASQSSNQQNVGGVLEEIFNNGGYSTEFAEAFADLLGSSSYDEALAVYDQLLGAEHAQMSLASFNAMNQFQGFLGERMDSLHNGMGTAKWALLGEPGSQVAAAETVLADGSPSPAMGSTSMASTRDANSISMFGAVNGNWASADGDTNGPGFSQDTYGISAGVDYALSTESLVGLGGSYLASSVDFDSGNSGDVDTFAVGLFGTFGLGGGYLDANANVAMHDVDSSRLTPAPDFAHASYSATSWSVSGEVGTVVPVGRAYVSPMLSLTYTGLSVDGFTETGSAFALDVQGTDTNSIATVLGARAGDYFKVGKATVNLQGNLGWRHEFGDETAAFTGSFVEDPSLVFNVDSSKIANDSATFGVGSTVAVSSSLEVFLNYDGVWNAEADSHNASLGVRANW